MAITEIDGLRQIQDTSISKAKVVADFLGGADWDVSGGNNDATITGLADGTNNDDAVNKGQMDTAIASALTGGMTYKGVIDASVATGETLDGAITGDYYLVSVAGTLDSISYSIGDHLVVNADITDFSVDGTGKIDKVDNTESDDILRDGDIVNNLTTATTGSVLDASQGKVLKDAADALQTEVDDTQTGAGLNANGTYTPDAGSDYITGATSLHNADSLLDDQIKTNADNIGTNASDITALQTNWSERVYGEAPTVTDGSGVLPALANIPVKASTAQVYLNGMRMRSGAGNDYTIVEATGVITFLFNLKDPKDTVLVDYEY